MTEHVFHDLGIYYRTNAFVPRRTTLVFVHGVSGSSSAWRLYEERFERHYNLLAYDLRGHGKSRKYSRCRDYAIPRFVDDLKALLEHLGIDDCILISHSFAVLIALEFVRAHQAGVQAMVLVSGEFDPGRHGAGKVLKTLLAPVALLDRLPFRPRAGRHIDYARYPNSGDWNLPRIWADAGNTTWRVLLYCTKQAYGVHADVLPRIGVPVLLVHGRKDTIFPVQNSIEMATQMPTAELVVLEDANHIVVLNYFHELGDAIEGFARRRRTLASNGAHAGGPS